MNNNPKNNNGFNKNNSSKFLSNLYGLLAVIFVLIPEWIAEYGIDLGYDNFKNILPKTKNSLNRNPYIFLNGLKIKELRYLASKMFIHGYSSDCRKSLIKRIHRRIKKRN